MYLLEYKVQLLRAAARYLGGRGGEGPMAVPDCMRAVHEKAKCPEFSGARVEISGARLEFEESSYKDEKYTMCEIRSKYGAYILLLRH